LDLPRSRFGGVEALSQQVGGDDCGAAVDRRPNCVPPSTHESGEAIEFVDPGAAPAEVDADELFHAVAWLADAVLIRLGEKADRRSLKNRKSRTAHGANEALPQIRLSVPERAASALQAMLRMRTPDHRDGSLRLYAAACRCVEHDLADGQAVEMLRQYGRLRPFPRDWTDVELLQRLDDARRKVAPGAALTPPTDDDGLIALGSRDPTTGRVVLSARRTLPTAIAYVNEHHAHFDGRTLHSHAGLLLEWEGSRYVEFEEAGALSRLAPWLHEAVRYAFDQEMEAMVLVPFDANPASMRNALDTIRAHVHLPSSLTPPMWLDQHDRPPADELLVCRTKLVHLPTGRELPTSPQLFVMNALDFDPDPEAPEPMEWHTFLHQLFDGDLESLELLQEWFGYALTADTSQQKMLLIVGPRRSGKGTIARVLRQLVGEGNVCGPTTSSLAGSFGLQPLIGKLLAIVSDARFVGEGITTVVERLLTISGEDAVSIDRKYVTSVTMKLPTRFMFLTNEFPRLHDASGALAGRFVILQLTESFYGKEDVGLTNRLLKELPGILNWAIKGWRRLRERGHFVMPSSSADAMRELEELSSPVQAFVREMCVVSAPARVGVNELYDAWRAWCVGEGRLKPSPNQVFGRDLKAAFPHVRRRRGTHDQRFYEGIGLRRDEP
jgi:putative DNA primase/helicase